MITRIVKLTFRNENIEAFKAFFNERKQLIRNVEGCTHLELWQDRTCPNTFFTYSHWESETHLNDYRSSPFFSETWNLTKQMFSEKAEAWTVSTIHKL